MAENLLQKIISGKYSKQELDDIIDHAMLAKETYNVVEKKIKKASNDTDTNKKLLEIDKNIKNLNLDVKKESKKQAKYILAITAIFLPALAALCVVSAFNTAIIAPGFAISIAALAAAAVPIGLMDYKRKKLLSTIKAQEQLRANILSDICFKVTPDYANHAYTDYINSKTQNYEINTENDNTFSI